MESTHVELRSRISSPSSCESRGNEGSSGGVVEDTCAVSSVVVEDFWTEARQRCVKGEILVITRVNLPFKTSHASEV